MYGVGEFKTELKRRLDAYDKARNHIKIAYLIMSDKFLDLSQNQSMYISDLILEWIHSPEKDPIRFLENRPTN